jgi:hypothetical protein
MAVINLQSSIFKKSNRDLQINLFRGIPAVLEGKSKSFLMIFLSDTTSYATRSSPE